MISLSAPMCGLSSFIVVLTIGIVVAIPDATTASSVEASLESPPEEARVSQTEAEAIAALEDADAAVIRNFPFCEVERLVNQSWWRAARVLTAKSHQAHVDFTAPVRQAVSKTKQQADMLLRWLDPAFANPKATFMATQWAQNATHVMVVARFAPRWDVPGANFAIYSGKGGQRRVDRDETARKLFDLLQINITRTHIEAEITAETQNVRKRYILQAKLFEGVDASASAWSVRFIPARRSTQMSSGAEIPELMFQLSKQAMGADVWPRLTESEDDPAFAVSRERRRPPEGGNPDEHLEDLLTD